MIPASSGTQEMAILGPQEHAVLTNAFNGLVDDLDVLVIDTAAGIPDSVISFVRASQEIVLLVCDEPSSITDAYALIKILHTGHGASHFRVVANMTRSPIEGENLFRKLVSVIDGFLDVTLQYAGEIQFDEIVRKSVKRQRASVEAFPGSKSSIACKKLAKNLARWPMPRGHLEFFVERLVSNPVGAWPGGEDCNLRRDD